MITDSKFCWTVESSADGLLEDRPPARHWPHDTAIAIWSMTRAGFAHRAAGLVDGLLAAAVRFDYRLPELYSGDGPHDGPGVTAYPAACRPQAWAAASIGAIVQCLLGLRTDLPAGAVRPAPITDRRFGAPRIAGLRAGAEEYGVEVDRTGSVTLIDAPARVGAPARPARDPDGRGEGRRNAPQATSQ